MKSLELTLSLGYYLAALGSTLGGRPVQTPGVTSAPASMLPVRETPTPAPASNTFVTLDLDEPGPTQTSQTLFTPDIYDSVEIESGESSSTAPPSSFLTGDITSIDYFPSTVAVAQPEPQPQPQPQQGGGGGQQAQCACVPPAACAAANGVQVRVVTVRVP